MFGCFVLVYGIVPVWVTLMSFLMKVTGDRNNVY